MGCDIHLFTERKRTINNVEQWVSMDYFKKNPYFGDDEYEREYEIIPLYRSRNYRLFAMLADVRNYDDNLIISEPKGFPDDTCKEIKKEKEYWDGDGHSYSYFTLKELKDFKKENHLIKYSGYVNKFDSERIDEGEMPHMWCKATNNKDFIYREWEYPNNNLDEIINNLEVRIRDDFYLPYDADTSKYDEKVRIVFWFDN